MSEQDKLRTKLANERTLLAYVRTALALLIFGMAAIKFFPQEPLISGFGWLFMLAGIATLIWGWAHCRRVSRLIEADQNNSDRH